MINKAREGVEVEKPKKAKKPKRINTQQRRFVKELVRRPVKRDAALAAGYSSGKYAYELLQQENIQSALVHELKRAGLDDELAASKMMDGLNAMTPPKKEGGERYDDQFVRKQYLDMYFRLKGNYAPTEHNINQKTININITPEMAAGLADAGAFEETFGEVKEEIIDGG